MRYFDSRTYGPRIGAPSGSTSCLPSNCSLFNSTLFREIVIVFPWTPPSTLGNCGRFAVVTNAIWPKFSGLDPFLAAWKADVRNITAVWVTRTATDEQENNADRFESFAGSRRRCRWNWKGRFVLTF